MDLIRVLSQVALSCDGDDEKCPNLSSVRRKLMLFHSSAVPQNSHSNHKTKFLEHLLNYSTYSNASSETASSSQEFIFSNTPDSSSSSGVNSRSLHDFSSDSSISNLVEENVPSLAASSMNCDLSDSTVNSVSRNFKSIQNHPLRNSEIMKLHGQLFDTELRSEDTVCCFEEPPSKCIKFRTLPCIDSQSLKNSPVSITTTDNLKPKIDSKDIDPSESSNSDYFTFRYKFRRHSSHEIEHFKRKFVRDYDNLRSQLNTICSKNSKPLLKHKRDSEFLTNFNEQYSSPSSTFFGSSRANSISEGCTKNLKLHRIATLNEENKDFRQELPVTFTSQRLNPNHPVTTQLTDDKMNAEAPEFSPQIPNKPQTDKIIKLEADSINLKLLNVSRHAAIGISSKPERDLKNSLKIRDWLIDIVQTFFPEHYAADAGGFTATAGLTMFSTRRLTGIESVGTRIVLLRRTWPLLLILHACEKNIFLKIDKDCCPEAYHYQIILDKIISVVHCAGLVRQIYEQLKIVMALYVVNRPIKVEKFGEVLRSIMGNRINNGLFSKLCQALLALLEWRMEKLEQYFGPKIRQSVLNFLTTLSNYQLSNLSLGYLQKFKDGSDNSSAKNGAGGAQSPSANAQLQV